MSDEGRDVYDDEQEVERKTEGDNRKRLQDADAKEEERENVRTRLRLTGNRLNGLGSNDAVADGRTESNSGDNQTERDQSRGNN